MKKRWNVLRQENRRALEHVVNDIVACCVLHNFGIAHGDPDDDFDELKEDERRFAVAKPAEAPPAGHDANFGIQMRRFFTNELYRLRR